MNSRVQVLDLVTGRRYVVIPSYHADSSGGDEKVSVLTPFGAALLGAHVGDEIEWSLRHGAGRIRVEAVLYQPEAAGDFHL
jgi:regulator of nucleoside diphosphate kinase